MSARITPWQVLIISQSDNLKLSGLNLKAGLDEGDCFLARVAVLDDEATGVAGEHDVGHFPLAAEARGDHIAGVSKMVGSRMMRDLTGDFGFVDNLQRFASLYSTADAEDRGRASAQYRFRFVAA